VYPAQPGALTACTSPDSQHSLSLMASLSVSLPPSLNHSLMASLSPSNPPLPPPLPRPPPHRERVQRERVRQAVSERLRVCV
jgi:hypothetical protein